MDYAIAIATHTLQYVNTMLINFFSHYVVNVQCIERVMTVNLSTERA